MVGIVRGKTKRSQRRDMSSCCTQGKRVASEDGRFDARRCRAHASELLEGASVVSVQCTNTE
jgi:hypothetical protein